MRNLVKTFENFQTEMINLEKEPMMNQPEMENYMFMGNLQTIKRCVDELLEMDPMQVDQILQNGHNWALDHITTSKDDIEEVYNFLVNETEPVEEAIGTLLLLAGGVLAGPGLIDHAKNMYQKHIVARQFKETGETKQIGKATFRGYEKDGEHYWGVDYTTRLGGQGFGKTHTLFFTEDQLPSVEKYLEHGNFNRADYNIAGEIADDPSYAFGPKAKHAVYRGDDNWKRPIEEPVSEMYQCDECSMTYEAHEVDESLTCECGGSMKPVYEKW